MKITLVSWHHGKVLEILFAKVDIETSGEELYSFFQIPKKSGGMRDIVAPHEKIKAALRDLNFMLQKVYDKRNEISRLLIRKVSL